jgi:CheY-like chemotaxis protein
MAGTLCVLVVDDEPAVRAAICETLEELGCPAIAACDGAEAQRRLESGEHPPCVIVLDLVMPGVNGWQFRAWQQADPRFANIPVVLISAQRDLAFEARRLGAEYVEKPVAFATLLAAIEKFCGACDTSHK